MKLQASHHGRDERHQAPPAVQTWSYRLDKAASYDSNLGNAELGVRFRREGVLDAPQPGPEGLPRPVAASHERGRRIRRALRQVAPLIERFRQIAPGGPMGGPKQ